jgi:hypothetical protein
MTAVDDTSLGSSVRLVEARDRLGERGSLRLLVMNHGDRPFEFGPDNVTARLADGTPLPIVSYDGLVGQYRRDRARLERRGAVQAALGSIAQIADSASKSGDDSCFARKGKDWASHCPYEPITNDAMLAAWEDSWSAYFAPLYHFSAAGPQNGTTFARLAEQESARIHKSRYAYLRPTTLYPRQMLGGLVMFDLPQAVRDAPGDLPISVTVRTAGEEHRFDALLRQR